MSACHRYRKREEVPAVMHVFRVCWFGKREKTLDLTPAV
jgi:hypothetical protein